MGDWSGRTLQDHQRRLPPAPGLGAGRAAGNGRIRVAAARLGRFLRDDRPDRAADRDRAGRRRVRSPSARLSARWSSTATAGRSGSRSGSNGPLSRSSSRKRGQGSSPIDLNAWTRPLGDRVAALPLARRLVLAPLALMAFRLLVALSALIPPCPVERPARASSGSTRSRCCSRPLGLVAGAAGQREAARAGCGRRSRHGVGGVRRGMIGLFAAAVGFALIQSVESILGSWSSSLPAATALWGVLGLGLALLSWLVLPPQATTSSARTEPTS